MWEYDPSLSRLTLRVESRTIPGNLHIICGGCKHYCGPLSWEQSGFELIHLADAEGGVLEVLRDSQVNVEVRCWAVSLVENVEPVY